MQLTEQSVRELCGESKEVVVYGFGEFNYIQVAKSINEIKGIHAVHSDDYQFKNSLEERYSLFMHFKAILNDLVLENLKREKKSEPIVPLIFIIGLDEKKLDVRDVASKSNLLDEKRTTHTELRRCYKLATEFKGELGDIANKTFKFVELVSLSKDLYELKSVNPPWLRKEFLAEWENRKNLSPAIKHPLWRNQLQEKADKLITEKETKNEKKEEVEIDRKEKLGKG